MLDFKPLLTAQVEQGRHFPWQELDMALWRTG